MSPAIKRKVRCRSGSRSQSGVNAIEVAINSFLMIGLVGMATVMTVYMIAVANNDSAARDAARAAGGIVTTQTDTYLTAQANALAAAQAQMYLHKVDGWLVSGTTTNTVPDVTMPIFYCPPGGTGATDPLTNQWGPAQTYTPSTGPTSPAVSVYPYVQCTTHVNVRMPSFVKFFGMQLSDGGSAVSIYRSYIFPMVRTKMIVPS